MEVLLNAETKHLTGKAYPINIFIYDIIYDTFMV